MKVVKSWESLAKGNFKYPFKKSNVAKNLVSGLIMFATWSVLGKLWTGLTTALFSWVKSMTNLNPPEFFLTKLAGAHVSLVSLTFLMIPAASRLSIRALASALMPNACRYWARLVTIQIVTSLEFLQLDRHFLP